MANHVLPQTKQERARSTVDQLIEATIAALEAHGESGVRLEDIFDSTGVARSSLYHHFGDRDGLIDAARLVQFSRMVDADIASIELLSTVASNAEEFREGLLALTMATQSDERRTNRLRRLSTLGASANRPALAEALAAEQERLTDRLADVVVTAQERGWVRADLDPRALASFVQAYSLGRVVMDIDPSPADHSAWVALVTHIGDAALLVNGSASQT
jgi:AcrR family transcriptional regulator